MSLCLHCKLVVADELCDVCFRLPRCRFCGVLGTALCVSCIGSENKIRDKCFECETPFSNSEEHYRAHGNLCKICSEDIDRAFCENYPQHCKK